MTTLVIVAVVLAWLLATTTYAEPVVPGPASDAELPAVPAAHDDRAGRRGAVRHGAGARGAGALAGSYRHGARGDRGVRGRGGRCGRGRRPAGPRRVDRRAAPDGGTRRATGRNAETLM